MDGKPSFREGSAEQATREAEGGFRQPERFASIDSTNRYLSERAREGAPEGVSVLAERQTAGRGRLGRRWIDAPDSSVLCSVLFRPALAVEEWHLLSWIVALSGRDACADVAGVETLFKWPNDLLAGDRKVAGVLAHVAVPPGERESPAVVVGIGINCNWPAAWPPRDDPDAADIVLNATSLDRAAGHQIDRDLVAARLLERVAQRYGVLTAATAATAATTATATTATAATTGPENARRAKAGIATEYRRNCATIGKAVRVDLADESFTGTAMDVDDRGRLLVDTGACTRTVEAGDVVHLR
jgi:BirA family biotin operon repressor/biotin-[acetyl-CoA-carboxylase] ligase